MRYIGIDTGVHTGVGVWDPAAQRLELVQTMTITQAMNLVLDYKRQGNVILYIEDARLRKWFGNTGREKLQGAGSVKRDAQIWEDFCNEHYIRFKMIAPKYNRTKMSATQFRAMTKWTGRTSEHSRDAALLVFGIN